MTSYPFPDLPIAEYAIVVDPAKSSMSKGIVKMNKIDN